MSLFNWWISYLWIIDGIRYSTEAPITFLFQNDFCIVHWNQWTRQIALLRSDCICTLLISDTRVFVETASGATTSAPQSQTTATQSSTSTADSQLTSVYSFRPRLTTSSVEIPQQNQRVEAWLSLGSYEDVLNSDFDYWEVRKQLSIGGMEMMRLWRLHTPELRQRFDKEVEDLKKSRPPGGAVYQIETETIFCLTGLGVVLKFLKFLNLSWNSRYCFGSAVFQTLVKICMIFVPHFPSFLI